MTYTKWPKKKKLLRLTQFEIENLNRLLTKIDSVINFFSQTTVIRWLHWWTLPNVSGRNKNPSQNISKNRKEPILKGPYYSDAKSRHMRVCKVASVMSDSVTLWTIACQASLSMDSPGFPGGSDGKSICLRCGRPGFDPWEWKIPGEGNGNPLQYSCLENPMDGGAW